MNNLAVNLNIYEIIEEYNKKQEEIPKLFDDISNLCNTLENECSTMGAYGGTTFAYDFTRNDVKKLLNVLKKSSWRYVYNTLNIEAIAPKTHLTKFEHLLERPPEFTADNIKSVFIDYVSDPRGMALKAFAEVFCTLDSSYKSHSNVKIGAKGLPKRVILCHCDSVLSYGWEKVADVINCLMRYRNRPELIMNKYTARELVMGDAPCYMGLAFKYYKNGNVHIIFDKQAEIDINTALHDYYGDVLPDVYEHTDKPAESTEVSKDLQFYRTPEIAVDKLLSDLYLRGSGETNVLEPSCGDGAIMEGIRKQANENNNKINLIGIECDVTRATEAREKGFDVLHDNFLTWKTDLQFDYIIMNPPFYGTHYAKHIKRAYELLKPGGTLRAILPITAQLNHGIIDRDYMVTWRDLPLGTFKESGTMINTVIATIRKREF